MTVDVTKQLSNEQISNFTAVKRATDDDLKKAKFLIEYGILKIEDVRAFLGMSPFDGHSEQPTDEQLYGGEWRPATGEEVTKAIESMKAEGGAVSIHREESVTFTVRNADSGAVHTYVVPKSDLASVEAPVESIATVHVIGNSELERIEGDLMRKNYRMRKTSAEIYEFRSRPFGDVKRYIVDRWKR